MAKYTKEQVLDRIEEIICEGCDNKGLCTLEQMYRCGKVYLNGRFQQEANPIDDQIGAAVIAADKILNGFY